MKFLATQETDFLSHVFHLYDSDLEEEDEDEEEGVVGQKKRGNGKSHFRWKVPMMERGTKATGNIIFAYGKD